MGKNGKYATDGKYPSPASHSSHEPGRIIPPRGDYQTLHSFHKAEVVYDITFRFAHKHLARGDRTVDQMIQAARSGKKNILEGSKAALTSKETEAQADQCGPRQPRGIARRLPRLPARAGTPRMGQGLQGSPVRPPARPQNAPDLRALPQVCGNAPARNCGQHRPLPHPSGQLPD